MNDTEIIVVVGSSSVTAAVLSLWVQHFLDRRRRKQTIRELGAALRQEMLAIGDYAAGYIKEDLPGPTYRFPVEIYPVAFPKIVDGAGLQPRAMRSIVEFYNQVATVNRGIDEVREWDHTRQIQKGREIIQTGKKVDGFRPFIFLETSSVTSNWDMRIEDRGAINFRKAAAISNVRPPREDYKYRVSQPAQQPGGLLAQALSITEHWEQPAWRIWD